ncbi:MAG: protein BatD [Bacteroidales bacterium]|nr:protein BatD [Bacteroidales bacterium]
MYQSKNIFLNLLLIITLSIIPTIVSGQVIKVTLDAPKNVQIDEQFQVTVTINAQVQDFIPPDFENFNVLAGPESTSGGSTFIENGRITRSWETNISYLLQPKKNGKFEILPAKVIINGKTYTSNSLNIEVSGQNPVNTPIDETGDLFLKVFLDKYKAYQGEYITGNVKLYSRYKIKSISKILLPSFDGFYSREIETNAGGAKQEIINGKTYLTLYVGKFVLIPQKTGPLSLAPCKIRCFIPINIFGEVNEEIAESKPVKVTIIPLPSRPASFTGGVGKFSFTASYDKTTVKANDPVILKLSVQGAGNLRLIEAPQLNLPEGVETSEPTTSEKLNENDGGISGTKQFEYLLIPRAPGKITLPPIEFSFFDPVAKQFKTITSPSETLNIEPGGSSGNIVSGSSVSREDVKYIGKDIEYIKLNNISLRKKGYILYGSLQFYLSYGLALLAFAGILFWRRNYIRQNSNSVLSRNKKAQKYAVKRLKKAKEYLAQSKKENFYEEVFESTLGLSE